VQDDRGRIQVGSVHGRLLACFPFMGSMDRV
jgi:hypothetical protein